ncbi:LOW QUALITY PROTEIN: hypothetical protein PHMEG_00014162 [Phytophthora megakarya]|uniref:Uncharacterized protein n=1 Tax=Phytophthora megakarya TaxID=4795 RepID=A0A225W4H5_9STRA|nr:LOW QUALITY PROTEIN: hypothetical protein PHMEG_00014162 [Phytophthora megakarya]
MTSRYKPELLKFMSYTYGVEYDSDHAFSMEELLGIIPEHICRWINELLAYGNPDPSDDLRPVHHRSATLEFSKKVISSFMPSVNASWDPRVEILTLGKGHEYEIVNAFRLTEIQSFFREKIKRSWNYVRTLTILLEKMTEPSTLKFAKWLSDVIY